MSDVPSKVIMTADDLHEMVEHYLDRNHFVFDVETQGDDRLTPALADLRWISFATEDRTDTIPMGHINGDFISERKKPNKKGQERMARGVAYEDLNPKYDLSVVIERFFTPPPEQLNRADVITVLAPLFVDNDILKIGHNVKYDLHVVAQYLGFIPEGPFFDTSIAAWLEDTQRLISLPIPKSEQPDPTPEPLLRNGLSLRDCVWRELGVVMDKTAGEDITQHSFSDVATYGLLDAQRTYELYVVQDARLSVDPAQDWLMDLEMQVLNPVLDMESHGVQLDLDRLAEIDKYLRDRMEEAKGTAFREAGREFNLRSNKAKQELLFTPKHEGGRGIRSAKLTPGGKKKDPADLTIYDYSVDREVLEQNAHDPLAAAMIDFNYLAKLHGTYVVPYLGGEVEVYDESGKSSMKTVESRTRNHGRVYGTFRQNGTESGRFSAADPNLQNIPSRSKDGKRIREAFVADEGHTLVVADYSQIEPRIIASLSGDKTMIETYRAGGDVYQAVADRMDVSRSAGKTLVLAIAYGVGPKKISIDIGCSYGDARDLMDYFDRQFPKIRAHKREVLRKVKRSKVTTTVLGRRRYLPDINNPHKEDLRARSERQAYNHLIQGTAADIMKMALVNIHATLPTLPKEAHMLLTVHDEVVISTPEDQWDLVAAVVKDEMEAIHMEGLVVPLVAEVGTGYRWSDAK